MRQENKTLLGIDYGTSQVGVALSKEGFVSPLTSLPCNASLVSSLLIICEQENVEQVVVGLPEEPQRRVVEDFIATFQEAFEGEVLAWDEVLTTRMAEEELRKLPKRRLQEQVDSASAAIILSDYLGVI